jgi:hypothetical protein
LVVFLGRSRSRVVTCSRRQTGAAVLGHGLVARFEADDLFTAAQQTGEIPTFEPPPPVPGESRLALYDIDPSVLAIVGRERLEAIAAEEALRFGLLDDSGRPVPGVDVTVHLREWPGYLTRTPGPPRVVVVSGIWVQDDSGQDVPPSRPEA